ncbi:MG321/MPN456 family lipoprotein [Malacoplasma iowae]|uniref:MG321/MPN456 family lipoprotein n=1 Tax=Malacoplasma iowae TaxID=2116 RepID=UPI002A1891AD|nr:MG321/MPN456 family lipoprotein [Malacoplasma iowae]WPL38014.1 hypothetical protein QX182_00600 [Malacoplasma iowae]
MKNNKKLLSKKVKSTVLLSVATIPIAVTLASCSSMQFDTDTLRWATTVNMFTSSKTPLGTTFVDSPSTTYFNSVFLNLVNWQTTGDYKFNDETGEATQTPEAHMILEGASEIKIHYVAEKAANDEDTEDKDNTNQTPIQNGSKKWVHVISDTTVNQTTGAIDLEKAKKALDTATSVEFKIREGLKWRDKNGNVMGDVTAKDFYAGMEGYYKSTLYGLNANSYFFSLAGIDPQETLKSEPTNDTFTFQMTSTPSIYLFDIISKGYFAAMPYNNPEVKPILTLGDTNDLNNPIVLTDNEGSKVIDQVNTNWNAVFGGGEQQTNVDIWSAGPYYIRNSTLQDVDFVRNDYYFQNVKGAGKIDEKIKNVILFYGNAFGNNEKIYRGFTTGELDYAQVPAAQQLEAVLKYSGTGALRPVTATKTTQGQFIAYNTDIYDTNGSLKSNIGPVYEKFVKSYYTDGLAIRKGINTLINYAKLAQLAWKPGKYDVTMSASPYGYLSYTKDKKTTLQYQQIREGNVTINGEKITGLVGDYKEQLKDINSNGYLLTNSMNNEEKKTYDAMMEALDKIGATAKTPLELDYRTLVSSYTNEQTKYIQELIKSISELTNNKVKFNLINRTNQTVVDYFYNANSPLGSYLWGPDYNAVGTWVGYYFQYKFDKDGYPIMKTKINGGDIEVGLVADTKTATLWPLLFKEMQAAVKKTNGKKVENDPAEGTGWSSKDAWLTNLWNYLVQKGGIKKKNQNSNTTLNVTDYLVTDITSGLSSQIATWGDLNQYNTYALVQWIDNTYPFIPNYEMGLDYKSFNVVRPGFNVLPSLNSTTNFKDWSVSKKDNK